MLIEKEENCIENNGRVVKLVDTLLLGSSAARHGSSSLPSPTYIVKWPGSQVVRHSSAKGIYGGSIPPQASKIKLRGLFS